MVNNVINQVKKSNPALMTRPTIGGGEGSEAKEPSSKDKKSGEAAAAGAKAKDAKDKKEKEAKEKTDEATKMKAAADAKIKERQMAEKME